MRRTVEDQSTIGYKRNEFIAIIKSINIFSSQQESEWRQQQKNDCKFFFGIFRSAFKNGGLCLGLMHQLENFYH